MPRIQFTAENKVQSGGPQINRLKLEKGERVRLMAGLETPTKEYVHTLRKPKIENGQAVMETIERFGKMVTQYEKEYVSRPLCEGDYEILEKDGIDPKNCPVCALATTDPEAADAPDARYAMNVFKYQTKPGGFNPKTPFGGEIVVWSFTQRTFNKIVDIAEEFGDLQTHDLNLGPCENAQWQKYDIAVAGNAAWRGNDDDKAFLKESFKENRLEELELACGQKKERRWLDRDLADIKNAWSVIRGTSTAPAENDTALDGDLGSLLDEAGAQTRWADDEEADEAPAKAAPKKESLTSLLDDEDEQEETPAPAKAAPKAKAKPAPAKDEDDDDDSFAALLDGLDD